MNERSGNVHAEPSAANAPPAAARAGRRRRDARRVERQIDHRGREQGQHLAHQEAAHDADAERVAQFGARARTEHERQGAEYRGNRRHEYGSKAQQAGFVNSLTRRKALIALRHDRKVDHQNRVLLHDADEQDDADQRNDGQIVPGQHQGEQRADAGRRQRR